MLLINKVVMMKSSLLSAGSAHGLRATAVATANLANGRKSKGPITEHGKAMVRANVGRHWGRGLRTS